jgi:hypothetical protein
MWWLLVIQFLGMFASAVAALIEIHTIVLSGPILGGIGLLLAALSYRRDLVVCFWFGISVLSVAVLCFTMILGFHWGPREASGPIGALIVVFALGLAPVGLFAIREFRQADFLDSAGRFQFGITSLLGAMFLTALLVGMARLGEESAALGILTVHTALAVYAVKRFYRNRQAKRGLAPADWPSRDRAPFV